MGQKTHPIGFRLGTTRTWSSRWFASKEYANLLHEDVKIRRYIKDALYHAVEKLKNELQTRTGKEIHLDIQEVVHPELDSQLVAENIALQLEKRVAFRRAMKKAVQSSVRLGAEGVRIACAGRLGGAEIARREWYRDGRVPLQTLRADLDFGIATAHTTYGTIGVKVWIFKGEVLPAARTAELV
jgi:small subunit ribosomal protein S3